MLLVNDMIKVQNRSQGPKLIPRSKMDPEVQNQPRGPKMTPRSEMDPISCLKYDLYLLVFSFMAMNDNKVS